MRHFEDELRKFADQYDERHGIEALKELKINVKELHRDGSRRVYEMKANLVTDTGIIHVQKDGWDSINVFNDLMEAIKTAVRRSG